MKQIELTSKLMLAIIGLTAVSAILIPTYAVPAITSADIVDNTIQSVDIKDGEVKTTDLASDAVTSPKIKDGTIQSQDIAAGVIPGNVPPTVHRVDGEPVTIAGGGQAAAEAVCPDGEIVTGGGYVGGSSTHILLNAPSFDGDRWFIRVFNTGSDEVTGFFAIAQCMDFSP